LPTGKVKEEVKFPTLVTLKVSMVDAANPFVFVRAKDLGLKGNENRDEFGNNEATLKKCEEVHSWSRRSWALPKPRKRPRRAPA
jgi:2-methylaconitate cis-trans-isomerase PrpF